MAEEYLDIVDDDDEVIGRDTRKHVHDAHAIHRGVHVFVINSRGEMLIQRRSLARDYYPGYLDISVGAQVSSGESYESAASRELMEELGCHSGPLEIVGRYNAYSVRQREKRMVFRHECDGPFNPCKDEVDGIEFVDATRLNVLLVEAEFTEGFKRSLTLFNNCLSAPAFSAPLRSPTA